jgi:membrane associated rhomboid family serine protease
MHRYWPESITMRGQDSAQLTRLLKLAAVLLVVGVVAAIALAIGGGPASVALWPAAALGVICGIVSLVQLARTTTRMRRDRRF